MNFHQHNFTAMASPCQFLLQGEAALMQQACIKAQAEVQRIEKKYSRYLDSSLLQTINKNAGIKSTTIDAETAGLLNYADLCYQQSDGNFDITSGILRRVWNFKSNSLPDEKTIQQLLPLINWYSVQWDQNTIFLPEKNMEIDFGGFGKEYAADRAAEIFQSLGIQHGLVDLGGDIRIIGDKADKSGWDIGIRNPSQPESAISHITLHQGAMATSGNYERFMQVKHQHYCHILKANTGWPVNHWASVTILAPQCLVAGSLATLTMLAEQKGEKWIREQEIPFLAIDLKGLQLSNF
ncbi:ApbE-like lipoprotein [Oleispira antarctica RB-8]|uniref:FAD:protein FMN transferase n=1 Tax=Oleispira antarctica RB-8 TaxID=698738 RepID=R4YPQ6_OLEAN|nr:ApbE-like lipoprotein [Oleispira antarctica RB-8]|tara:strand:- start:4649 stop:5533 length:885 start_codon:yes stop_codon:yes gene_type:complete